jgi:hypothetical protein
MMMGKLLVALVLIGSVAFASRADAFVYWVNDESIGRAPLDGSGLEGLDQSFISGGNSLRGIAVDANHIYWTSAGGLGGGAIRRTNLGGTPAPFIIDTSPERPQGIAVDANHIYWANESSTTLGRSDLDGTNVDKSFITGASDPFDVAVDANHIYWTNRGSNSVGRADLDGTNVDQSFITGVSLPLSAAANLPFAVAVDANHIYWTNWDLSGGIGYVSIGRADLDSTNVDKNFIPWAGDGGIAVDANHIYWASYGDIGSGIGRADLDGKVDGGIRDVSATDLAVDSGSYPQTAITSGREGVTKDESASFAFESDKPGSSFECRLDRRGPGNWGSCTSPKQYSNLADGFYDFRVRATDSAANTDPSPAYRSFGVDTRLDGSVAVAKKQRQKGTKIKLKAKVKAGESFTAEGSGKVKVKANGKPTRIYRLKTESKPVIPGPAEMLVLTPKGRKQDREIVKAIREGKKLLAPVSIKLTDRAGNSLRARRVVRMR